MAIDDIRDLHIVRSGTPMTLEVLRQLGARTLAEGEHLHVPDANTHDAAATVPIGGVVDLVQILGLPSLSAMMHSSASPCASSRKRGSPCRQQRTPLRLSR
jgi:hypothetical protein